MLTLLDAIDKVCFKSFCETIKCKSLIWPLSIIAQWHLVLGYKEKNLHNLGSSLGGISKQLQIPRSVQTTVRKFKLFGCVTTLARFGRRPKLSPSDERKLLGTTKAQACHELEIGTKQEKKKFYVL
uniref:Uncharacterized protein n=1 Tax=Oreochromis aureus TaxID=47969 RepID=A0AAZ1X2E5_OREAU